MQLKDTPQAGRDMVVGFVALFWGVVGLGKKKLVLRREVEKEMMSSTVRIVLREARGGSLGGRLDGREEYLLARLLEVLTKNWPTMLESAKMEDVILVMDLLPRLVKSVERVEWQSYFTALAATIQGLDDDRVPGIVLPAVIGAVSLQNLVAYRAFGEKFLTTPGVLEKLGPKATAQLLANVDLMMIKDSLTDSNASTISLGTEETLWLLAHVLYLTHQTPIVIDLTREDRDLSNGNGYGPGYLPLISYLLYPIAGEIHERIAVEDTNMDDDDDDVAMSRRTRKNPLPTFVKSQIERLVKQESIVALLNTSEPPSTGVKALSRYAINLLIAFPTHRSEIRMWLNLAKTRDGLPALRYVWDYVKNSRLFADIKKDEGNARQAMKVPPVCRVDRRRR